MTEEELRRTPGAVVTQSAEVPVQDDVDADADAAELILKPLDFRLNLQAKLAEPIELTNLDNPSIRKLTWEQVVPERSEPAVITAEASAPPLPPPTPAASPVIEVPAAGDGAAPKGQSAETPVVEPVAADVEPSVAREPEPVAPARVAAAVTVEPRPPVDEVNRLANVPDMVVDDSPIEIPPITPAGSAPATPVAPPNRSLYTPVLPETVFVPSPRPPQPNVAAIVAESHAARRRSGKRRVRQVLHSITSLVIVFGLLAGGAYAAKRFLLKAPQWPAGLKPLATDVETQRGLTFASTVPVTSVTPADYAKRLADYAIGTQADVAPAWRALGLLGGELDLVAVGTQAMNDAPAFYDPATKTVYVSDDLSPYEHLYRFALRRALTAALLDQQFSWGSKLSGLSKAGVLALRAVVDADALAVANALAANDAPDQLGAEAVTFAQGHTAVGHPVPYAAVIAGKGGVALRPLIESLSGSDALAGLEQSSPQSDALFDAARADAQAPMAAGTQGITFWYYVLASRIDDAAAWAAALHWSGDMTVSSAGASGSCVDATIAAVDSDGATAMIAAFQSWAAAAPPESTTTVTAADNNQIIVHACDPGVTVAAASAVKVPVTFGGVGRELALVQAARSAADSSSTVDAACLVSAARQRAGGLTSDDDPPVISVNWKPVFVAANLDLGPACVTAAPATVGGPSTMP